MQEPGRGLWEKCRVAVGAAELAGAPCSASVPVMEPLPWDKPGPAAVDTLNRNPCRSSHISLFQSREERSEAKCPCRTLHSGELQSSGAAGPQGDCGQGGPGRGRHRGIFCSGRCQLRGRGSPLPRSQQQLQTMALMLSSLQVEGLAGSEGLGTPQLREHLLPHGRP